MEIDRRTQILWRDRNRVCGMPLSFEIYEATEDRVMFTEGFLNMRYTQIMLYMVRDVHVSRSFSQLLCGVGTVVLTTFDNKVYKLKNIRQPMVVKEFLHQMIEDQKRLNRYRFNRFDPYDDWPRESYRNLRLRPGSLVY